MLYALCSSDGHTVWSFPTGGALVNSAAYDNGRVFFGSTDHFIYAVHAISGTLAWKVETGSTHVITNTALIAGEANGLLERHALIVVNGRTVFLPLIRR